MTVSVVYVNVDAITWSGAEMAFPYLFFVSMTVALNFVPSSTGKVREGYRG